MITDSLVIEGPGGTQSRAEMSGTADALDTRFQIYNGTLKVTITPYTTVIHRSPPPEQRHQHSHIFQRASSSLQWASPPLKYNDSSNIQPRLPSGVAPPHTHTGSRFCSLGAPGREEEQRAEPRGPCGGLPGSRFTYTHDSSPPTPPLSLEGVSG